MTEYRVERCPEGHQLEARWGMWRVLGPVDEQVGLIFEMHQFEETQWGPATYAVAHNPSGEAGVALWNSENHSTVPEALAALVCRLESDRK